MSDRNLILSFATGTNPYDVGRFLRSARACCPPETTDIVLFIDPTPTPTPAPSDPTRPRWFAELLTELRIGIVPAQVFWREVSGNTRLKLMYRGLLRMLHAGSRRRWKGFEAVYRTAARDWIHPQAGRYLFYADYLDAAPAYGRVMLSDARDVVFQADPFTHIDPERLNAFAQDPSLIYGGDNVDTHWMPRVYGPAVIEALHGRQTLCSGTTLASAADMRAYLRRMEAEVLSHRAVPLDQAMHNKVVHLDFPEQEVTIHANDAGPVLTLHGVSPETYRIEDDRLFIGERLVPVLHQYDRIPAIKAMAERRWQEGGSSRP